MFKTMQQRLKGLDRTKFLLVHETSERIGYSKAAVRLFCMNGKLDCQQMPNKYRVITIKSIEKLEKKLKPFFAKKKSEKRKYFDAK